VVNDRNTIDLCPKDPGFPADLYVTTDIRTENRAAATRIDCHS